MSEEETTKKFGRLLSAVGELGEDLHGQGVIDLEQLRISIPARRIEAKRLVEQEGKSQRQAARELGVDKETVRRDLGLSKVSQNAPKVSQNAPLAIDDQDCAEERWQQSLKGFSFDATRLREYWNREFPGWESYETDDEVMNLVRKAIHEWSEIGTIIEDKLKWVR